MTVAYVFPGQGSQRVGMGKDLYETFEVAKNTFQEANEILGINLSQLCFEGPEDELRQTINAQPAIVTVSFACLRSAQEYSGENLSPPNFVAGHSLGEYTALAAANVLDFQTTVYLARERGRLMHEAGQIQEGAMVAIIGLDEAKTSSICHDTGTKIANINCPGQLVISGAKEGVDKATQLAKEAGAYRAIPLQVSGAFHTPLMEPAMTELSRIITGLDFQKPNVPIIANTSAQPITTIEMIKEELVTQLCNCIQWQRSIEYMIANGTTQFIEIGPGRVLSGLIKRIDKIIPTANLNDITSIKDLTDSGEVNE